MLQKGWLMISLLALTACAPDGGDTSTNELAGTTWVYTDGSGYEQGCTSGQDGGTNTYAFTDNQLTYTLKSCRVDSTTTYENIIEVLYTYTVGGTYLSTTGVELTELDLKRPLHES